MCSFRRAKKRNVSSPLPSSVVLRSPVLGSPPVLRSVYCHPVSAEAISCFEEHISFQEITSFVQNFQMSSMLTSPMFLVSRLHMLDDSFLKCKQDFQNVRCLY